MLIVVFNGLTAIDMCVIAVQCAKDNFNLIIIGKREKKNFAQLPILEKVLNAIFLFCRYGLRLCL